MLQLSADGAASNALSCTSLVDRMAGMALGFIECASKEGLASDACAQKLSAVH